MQSLKGTPFVHRRHSATTLGLAAMVLAAACTQSNAPMSPSSGLPVSLDAHSASARAYKVGIDPDGNPTAVLAGSTTTFTVRVTNCAESGTGEQTCEGGAHSGNQTIKSATIAIPDAFTNVSSLDGSVSTGTNWGVPALNTGTAPRRIELNKGAGGQNIAPGQWVEVTFQAKVPCAAGTYDFTSVGYNADNNTTPYALAGPQATVTVTGSCQEEECPAAPSIAARYIHFDLGIHPNTEEYGNIVAAVAAQMGPGTAFQGSAKCDADYADKVRAFVDSLLS